LFQQFHLFAGLSLYVGLTIFFNRRGFKSSQMAVFSFLLLAEEDKFEPHPSIHPWPNQPVYIRRHVAHSRRPFLFRKKNKTGEEKKEREQTIRKIVQQQNGVSLLY
jgi:hypothetical protein